jgi:type IV pilus assembly protein PilY1
MPSDTGVMGTFNSAAATKAVSDGEGDINGTRRFIGHALGNPAPGVEYDGAPTPKIVGDLSRIRGLAPEEPTKQGGYYAAGVAYFGNSQDINPATGRQKVQTFSVALASPLPRIEIPFGDRKVTLVPFAKSPGPLGGWNISPAQGAFQPTNTIVDFYYDVALSNPPDRYFFRINYEDVEQGADHDMDAIVEYDIRRTGPNTLTVDLRSTFAAGSIIQHMGYVISGTENDGIYLEARDVDTAAGSDVQYFLDTPPGQYRTIPDTVVWNDGVALPTDPPARTFTVGASPGATLLKDPLWYAAKWGGFVDSNNNNRPDLPSEWNQDGDLAGTPDNYFLVTNALKLSEQLSKAFDEILKRATSASSVALNSGSLSSESRVYQAKFNSDGWTGQLLSFKIDQATGEVPADFEWDAAQKIPDAGERTILSMRTDGTPIPFRWAQLDAAQQALLDPANDGTGDERLDYLRGVDTLEVAKGGTFRNRAVKLGDIVASSPVFVGPPRFFYRDNLESKPYSAFRELKAGRTPIVYAGANDGMLHGFHAGADADGGGTELLAYVPRAVQRNLAALSNPSYQHRFYVDGSPTAVDAFVNGNWRTVLVGGLNAGGQAIYALNVTDPGDFDESSASDIVMWEFDDRDTDGAGPDVAQPDLGLTYSRPLVVRLANGEWAAVFGNGYNSMANDGSASATGNAVLYVVNLATGQLIRRIDTGVGLSAVGKPPAMAGKGNGLSSPAAVDVNADDIIDYVYAGDLYGNLWKFDFRSANPSAWDVAYKSGSTNLPLFVAANASSQRQSITSRPSIGRGPRGVGMVVLFGTGRYIELADKDVATLNTQSFYGLYDPGTGTAADLISGRAQLLQQRIAMEISQTFGDMTYTTRSTTANTPTGSHRGWFMDLRADQRTITDPVTGNAIVQPGVFEGEMQVSDSILRSGRILFTTLIPSQNPCDPGGTSWLMSLDALTGARLGVVQFDLNNDGQFDDSDKVTGQPIPSGVKSGLGIVQKPGVLADNPKNQEFLYASGTSGDKPCGIGGAADGATDDDACRGLRSRFGPFDLGRQSWRQVR